MKFRTLLLGLSALFVAFNAAFFSVSGLSKLFVETSLSVMLMASSLELVKLITIRLSLQLLGKDKQSI